VQELLHGRHFFAGREFAFLEEVVKRTRRPNECKDFGILVRLQHGAPHGFEVINLLQEASCTNNYVFALVFLVAQSPQLKRLRSLKTLL